MIYDLIVLTSAALDALYFHIYVQLDYLPIELHVHIQKRSGESLSLLDLIIVITVATGSEEKVRISRDTLSDRYHEEMAQIIAVFGSLNDWGLNA